MSRTDAAEVEVRTAAATAAPTTLEEVKASIESVKNMVKAVGVVSVIALILSIVSLVQIAMICHPGTATVELEDGRLLRLEDASPGDLIRTPSGYEPIVAFTHSHRNIKASYVRLTTASASIDIARGHWSVANASRARRKASHPTSRASRCSWQARRQRSRDGPQRRGRRRRAHGGPSWHRRGGGAGRAYRASDSSGRLPSHHPERPLLRAPSSVSIRRSLLFSAPTARYMTLMGGWIRD